MSADHGWVLLEIDMLEAVASLSVYHNYNTFHYVILLEFFNFDTQTNLATMTSHPVILHDGSEQSAAHPIWRDNLLFQAIGKKALESAREL